MNPEVSVVIPSYNYGHMIEACIASVRAQRGVNMEIIVIDDGSVDDTRKRIARIPEVKYEFQRNSGSAAARNHGASIARGEFLQFLDADDLLGPNCLSNKLKALKGEAQHTIVVGRTLEFEAVNTNGNPIPTRAWRCYKKNLEIRLLRSNIAPPHSFLFPRRLTLESNVIDPSYIECEDYDFWLRALEAGYSFKHCFNSLVYYRRHFASKGAQKTNRRAFKFDVKVAMDLAEGRYGPRTHALVSSDAGRLALMLGALKLAAKIDPQINEHGIAQLGTLIKRLAGGVSGRVGGKGNAYRREEILYGFGVLNELRELPSFSWKTEVLGILEIQAPQLERIGNLAAGALLSLPGTTFEGQSLLAQTVILASNKLKQIFR